MSAFSVPPSQIPFWDKCIGAIRELHCIENSSHRVFKVVRLFISLNRSDADNPTFLLDHISSLILHLENRFFAIIKSHARPPSIKA